MEYEIQITNDELAHHGVRGMKWGVRRYQHKDGSLTKAGKRRYESQLKAMSEKERTLKRTMANKKKIDKLNAKKSELEAMEKELKGKGGNAQAKPTAPRPKSVSEMTIEELRAHTERMNAEKNYYDAKRNLAAANPPQVSKGKKFVNSLMNDVVAPAAKNAGKAYLEKVLKDKLGVDKKDSLDALEKQAKKLKATKEIEEYKRDIEKIKNGNSDGYPEIKTWDDLKKSRDFFDEEEKRRNGQGGN